jgi:RNA polymerase sigma-70 factor (ECF subfamily)
MSHGSHPQPTAILEHAASAFLDLRPRLLGIAYRILGSATEAEDIVQEVWLRWQATDRTVVKDPPALLATTTTRLALNVTQSAGARRESTIGPWLSEPVDTTPGPELGLERAEAVEFAVLLLLQKLTPTERAAFILREAFDYSYEQIASMLRLSVANARQLVSRARKHLGGQRRLPVRVWERQRLLGAILDASQRGDLSSLEIVLTSDVVRCSEGVGDLRAARTSVAGRERAA